MSAEYCSAGADVQPQSSQINGGGRAERECRRLPCRTSGRLSGAGFSIVRLMKDPRQDAGQARDHHQPYPRAPAGDPASEEIRHERALELIAQLGFQVAKSMPEIPHQYTVRDKVNAARETAYVQLFHLIQTDGVIEGWRGGRTRFLYPGDGYKYWAVTTSEPESRVINRMRIEDDIERPRMEGQVTG